MSNNPNNYPIQRDVIKVSAMELDAHPFTIIKGIEDLHNNVGICAIGQTSEDRSKDLYSVSWTNNDTIVVFVTVNRSESIGDVLDRFDRLNCHLTRLVHRTGTVGDDIVHDRYTISITYTSATRAVKLDDGRYVFSFPDCNSGNSVGVPYDESRLTPLQNTINNVVKGLAECVPNRAFRDINEICKDVDANRDNLGKLRAIASEVIKHKTEYSLVHLRFMVEYINDATSKFGATYINSK